MSLQTALQEYQMHKDAFGALVIDLKSLRTINHKYGQPTGDHALQEAANTLIGALRPMAVVGRWGRDEFIAVVRHVNGQVLGQLAERCRALVGQTSVRSADGRPVALSVSIGSAVALLDDSAQRIFKRADALMYENKTSGQAFTR
jgi:diguanylate cyclase (GGDEF)-like protein